MKSREDIKNQLIAIATQNGYTGEMIEISSDLLSYVLYQNQIEIANASQENSLATAKLINSKIHLCMESMYSVYRGSNARVILNFKSNTIINKKKFDLVYESNTFKLYAANNYSFIPGQIGQMECIFVSNTKYEYEVEITDDNRYYIDIYDPNNHLLNDISEDIKVIIDDQEYPTTRNFYDHVNTPISNDPDNLDKLFILTIPDYGVRIYKRGYLDEGQIKGYFKIGSKVHAECFKYTTIEEINPDEFSKIKIPGTELKPINGSIITYKSTTCKLKGSVSSKDELNDYAPTAEIGDTYDLESELFAYLNTVYKNPDYIEPENNPETITLTQYQNQSTDENSQLANQLYEIYASMPEEETPTGEMEKVSLVFKIKGRLANISLLPRNNAELGDTYFINNRPYVFLINNSIPNFYLLSSSISDWLVKLWKLGLENIAYKGQVEAEYKLPYSKNEIGDTYILDTYNNGTNVSYVYTYLEQVVSNPDYVSPEDNPEYKNGKTFISIGYVDDYPQGSGIDGRKSIIEVKRETEDSILYNANSSNHTQSTILSSSDVCTIFTEYFIEVVSSASMRYCPKGVTQGKVVEPAAENTLYIFYVPKVDGYEVEVNDVISFKNKYNSYFITSNMIVLPAKIANILVSLTLTLNDQASIYDQINNIFNKYENVLPTRSGYSELEMEEFIGDKWITWDYYYYNKIADINQIYSQLSKISQVSYINELSVSKVIIDGTEVGINEGSLPTSIDAIYNINGVPTYIRTPLYYNFELSINYKSQYETIS